MQNIILAAYTIKRKYSLSRMAMPPFGKRLYTFDRHITFIATFLYGNPFGKRLKA